MFDDIKEITGKALSFASRHLVWILLVIIGLAFLQPGIAEIKTGCFIVAGEGLALLLSGMAQYAYTKVDFVNFRIRGETREEISYAEKAASIRTLGIIFLAVHIFVGLMVLGYYFTKF